MKKIAITLSLMAVSALFAGEEIRTEIGVSAGFHHFDSASVLSNSPFYGIRATAYETEVNKFGFQVGYEGSMDVDYDDRDAKTDMHRFYTHLVVDGEEEYKITPYLFVGAGYEYLSDEITGEPSQGFVDLGVGFKYYMNNNFNVALETRALGKFDTHDIDYGVTLVFGYMIGGKYQSTVEPIIAFDEKIKKESPQKEEVIPSKVVPTMLEAVNPPVIEESKYVREVADTVKEADTTTKESKKYTIVKVQADAMPMDDVVAVDDYYVQMAALNVTSTQPLVDKLHASGYGNTHVHARENTQLVLVGPYSDKTEAREALNSLKHIKRDAFIYKMQ